MKRASITEEFVYGGALDRLTGADKPAEVLAKEAQSERPRSSMIKLSVFLNSDEDAYLEKLSATAKFSGGKKLSKTKIIEAMVKAFSGSGLDVRGVVNDEELFQRVSTQMRI